MTTKNPKFIINQIRKLLSELEGLNFPLALKGKTMPTPLRGLTGEIFNLIEEGFFDQSKDLSEIRKKLEAEGIKKNSSELMRPLLQLIRKKFLKRDKIEKKYKYQCR